MVYTTRRNMGGKMCIRDRSNAADVPALSGETLAPVEESVPRVLRVRGLARTIGERCV